ncbi:hypothetical protein ACFE04_014310 [Oxalis oulophora]
MSLTINKSDTQLYNNFSSEQQQQLQKEEEERCSSSSTTTTASTASSSSIGRNSDDDDEENEEVQSVFNGSLDMMDSLEEVLPMRRGISQFYNGKSKSFTSLVKASSTNNIKEVAKPENAYTRRRRNLLAFNHHHSHHLHRAYPYRTTTASTGIGKRSIATCRSTLALAVSALSSSESISNTSDDSNGSPASPVATTLPPLHPNSAWRSFSVFDLPQCGIDDASCNLPSYRQT